MMFYDDKSFDEYIGNRPFLRRKILSVLREKNRLFSYAEKKLEKEQNRITRRNKHQRKVCDFGVLFFKEKKTFREIALTYGITYQRVGQILRKHPDFKDGRVNIVFAKTFEKKCPYCGNIFFYKKNKYGSDKKFCNRMCFHNFIRKNVGTEEWILKRRQEQNRRTKEYYHAVLKHDPNFKKKSKERNDAYLKKKQAKKASLLAEGRKKLEALLNARGISKKSLE